MSTHSSEAPTRAAAGQLVASAILREAGRFGSHGRLYTAGVHGLEPTDIAHALWERAQAADPADVTLGGVALRAIRTSGNILIPYLVDSSSSAGPGAGANSGSRGFGARLRDEVADSAGGPPYRILLVLDPSPVETVTTAARNAQGLPSLSWEALVEAALAGVPLEAAVLKALHEAVARSEALPRSAETLSALVRLARSPDPRALGAELHQLPIFLADPDFSEHATADRLATNARWRRRIEDWTLPEKDFRSEAVKQFGAARGGTAEVLVSARGPQGVDFSRVALAMLLGQTSARGGLRFARPLVIGGAEAYHARAGNAAIWLPGGGTLALRLGGTPLEDDRAVLTWSDGQTVDGRIDADYRWARFDLPGGAWRYGTVRLSEGDAVNIAVYGVAGTWFPVEAGVALDIADSAFRHEGAPEILAIGPGGTILGYAPVAEEEESAVYTGRARMPDSSEQHEIPLRWVGPPSTAGPAVPPTDDPDARTGEDDDETDPQDEPGTEGRRLPSLDMRPQHSAAHVALEFARLTGSDEVKSVSLGAAPTNDMVLINGSQRYDLLAQTVVGRDGLSLEDTLIRDPGTWAWALVAEVGAERLVPDPEIQGLQLSALNAAALRRFETARHALFAKLEPYGTAHAIGAGIAHEEASEYCAAYAALLASLPRGEPYKREYDRLFLCDAITSTTSDEILVAPTNPLTIAFLLSATRTLRSWRNRASKVIGDDLRAIGIRHALPVFKLGQTTYECVTSDAVPWLWRRYIPQASGRAETSPRAIRSRLEHFLEVFPEYRSDRQHLAVALIEPAKAQSFLEAVRLCYEARRSAASGSPEALPYLDVTIVTANPELPTVLESVLAGSTNGLSSREQELDRLLRNRISLTKVSELSKVRFAHLAFVFRSELVCGIEQVKMSSRASTMWAGGLAAGRGRLTTPGPNETAFSSGTFASSLRAGAGRPEEHSTLHEIVCQLHELVGGMPNLMLQPGTTQMPTTRVRTGFLREVYARAVWVVHLDGMLGLEAFAPEAIGTNPRYVIDYDDRPDPSRAGLDVITATERVEPYHRALAGALEKYGKPQERGLERSLQLMNSVSGRWSLGLLGASPEQLAERVGVVAAIAAIADLDGAFDPEPEVACALLPLDELLELVPAAARGRSVTSLCDDLLYVRIPAVEADHVRLSARLIEVKHHQEGLSHISHSRGQLEATIQLLGRLFSSGEPQSPFRSRDLAEAIRAGIVRARAFGLTARDLDPLLEVSLQAIADGDFTLSPTFYAGGSERRGDVISLEPGSEIMAHRGILGGSGEPLGYVRLGRPVLRALAAGQHLQPPADWPLITFDPPGPEGGRAEQLPQPDPAADPSASVVATASGQDAADTARGGTGADEAAGTGDHAARLTAEVSRLAADLDSAVAKYGLSLEPFLPAKAQAGPSLIRFRARTLGRQTLSAIQARDLDIGREIGVAEGVLVGQENRFITIDVPREEPEIIRFSDYAALLEEPDSAGALNFLVGMAPDNSVRIADLARLPHLLVAGATGSGKSVFLRGLLCSLVRTRSPMSLSLMLIDPKQVDFVPFQNVLHLADGRIITDPAEAIDALSETLEREVPSRQARLAEAGVYNAEEFYSRGGTPEELPQMVVLVDEFADLVSSLGRNSQADFLRLIQQYSQKTRALGIYLVLATQRPSVKVITGDIKNNLTARVALKVPARQDSQTILGESGAESLRRKGDMIFDDGESRRRLQGFLCTTDDVREAVSRWDAPPDAR